MPPDPKPVREFVVPTCVTCGHTPGEHRSTAGFTKGRGGICLHEGCDCKEWVEQEASS